MRSGTFPWCRSPSDRATASNSAPRRDPPLAPDPPSDCPSSSTWTDARCAPGCTATSACPTAGGRLIPHTHHVLIVYWYTQICVRPSNHTPIGVGYIHPPPKKISCFVKLLKCRQSPPPSLDTTVSRRLPRFCRQRMEPLKKKTKKQKNKTHVYIYHLNFISYLILF